MNSVCSLIEIEKKVVDYYLNSDDFNGLAFFRLLESFSENEVILRAIVIEGIEEERIRIISSEHEMNPHIVRLGFRDKDAQVKSIKENLAQTICIYPGIELLQEHLKDDEYRDSPFIRMLAEGAAKLDVVFFQLELLEYYRNDPRYSYNCNDIGGRICISDEHYESDDVEEKDKVLIKAFGLAYDDDFNRYIAAFVGDISALSSEHQGIWKSKQTNKELKVHPDFYGAQIFGRWPTHISIFDAVLHEQRIINSMGRRMGKPDLFKRDFGRYLENKPKEFAFLLRPTLRDYEEFIHLLDKLMSDSINKKFFKGDVEFEEEIERKDGKIIVTQKGTIVLLDQWLRSHYNTTEWEPWDFAISVFRSIRKQRQSPAHDVNENKYDPSLIQKQRELMQDVCESLMILRHALSTHPLCKGYDFEIPKALEERNIWTV
jgi:hypothetical protein